LTLLEIILGIDNIVVISILAQKLPQAQQARLGCGIKERFGHGVEEY